MGPATERPGSPADAPRYWRGCDLGWRPRSPSVPWPSASFESAWATSQLFKSSGIIRPLEAIVIAGILIRRSALVATLAVLLSVAWWMPVSVYESTIRQLRVERHPIRDASDCVRQVEAEAGGTSPVGLYVDTGQLDVAPDLLLFPSCAALDAAGDAGAGHSREKSSRCRRRFDRVSFRKIAIVTTCTVRRRRGFSGGPSPPMISMFEYVLLLPGPYSRCSTEARLQARADPQAYGSH